MSLRTPRRRISPRTKRRYKAIKGFFTRALGTQNASQPDLLRITSSIAVNVTDINRKIVGLEQQLTEVSKHCHHNINLLDNNSIKSRSRASSKTRNEISQQHISDSQLIGQEPNIVYNKSENLSKKSSKSDRVPRSNNEINKVESIRQMTEFFNEQMQRAQNNKSKTYSRTNYDGDVDRKSPKAKNKSKFMKENFTACSTSSFYSLDEFEEIFHSVPGHSDHYGDKRNLERNYHKAKIKDIINASSKKPESYDCRNATRAEKYTKSRKSKCDSKELDRDFIADIINRQYKPVKMFGRKQSDQSLFSAPTCRDRDLGVVADRKVAETPQRLACNCGGRHFIRYSRHSDCSDMRSVSDARLYNVNKHYRTRRRRKHADVYDDSNIYDLVPVKEKTSPKSRRKFHEDNNIPSTYYKEVPPSPRSNRPRLNLRARISESNYYSDIIRNPDTKVAPKTVMRHVPEQSYYPSINRSKTVLAHHTMADQETDGVSENHYLLEMQSMEKHNVTKSDNRVGMERQVGTMSSLYQAYEANENTATELTPLNNTQESIISEKTDKALCEIKDILQNFLLEIKKEASSHSAKSIVAAEMTENGSEPPKDIKSLPINGPSFNNYSPAHCPVVPTSYVPTIPTFANTCCCRVMPICPINCMQNNYAVPSASFPCNNCDEKSIGANLSKKIDKNDAINNTYHSETEELIKKIYKFVSRSPTSYRKNDPIKDENNTRKMCNDTKELTSRSAGGSAQICKHNVKVGTRKMNCVSKSCEAINMKVSSGEYSSETNASLSDTILGQMSHYSTGTTTLSNSITESSSEFTETDKGKRSRFTKVMQSLGLFKKTKKPVIEDSETESTIEEMRPHRKKKPPFRQDIINYGMYGQEYYRPPPTSARYHPDYPDFYRPPYNPNVYQDPRMQQSANRTSPQPKYGSGKSPTAPPYPYESYNMQPQVPLCLKEVEVKSIGCQSDRKTTFLQKLTRKIQPSPDMLQGRVPRHGTTQTQIAQNKPQAGGLFNWKTPQTKLTSSQLNMGLYKYKTKKKLAGDDAKIRNAVIKKMFYNKKNPFSPKNLLVKTLLG